MKKHRLKQPVLYKQIIFFQCISDFFLHPSNSTIHCGLWTNQGYFCLDSPSLLIVHFAGALGTQTLSSVFLGYQTSERLCSSARADWVSLEQLAEQTSTTVIQLAPCLSVCTACQSVMVGSRWPYQISLYSKAICFLSDESWAAVSDV